MSQSASWAVPPPDLLPLAEAVRSGRLVVLRCGACDHRTIYPRPLCPNCHSADLNWQEVSGSGEVYTFTIVYRAPSAALAKDAPYVIAVVELDEGGSLMSRLVDTDVESVRIGDRVEAVFNPVSESVLPFFRKVAEG